MTQLSQLVPTVLESYPSLVARLPEFTGSSEEWREKQKKVLCGKLVERVIKSKEEGGEKMKMEEHVEKVMVKNKIWGEWEDAVKEN